MKKSLLVFTNVCLFIVFFPHISSTLETRYTCIVLFKDLLCCPFLFYLIHCHCVFEFPIFKAVLNSQADMHIKLVFKPLPIASHVVSGVAVCKSPLVFKHSGVGK